MAVSKQELHRMIDHLDQAGLDDVHSYLLELRETEEEELSKGQVEGLYDQDAYFEEGEINPEDMKTNEDVKRRG
ncbi:hypothetical protein [Alteribacter aurantiacus]|uniref:hypothetical protein n=1 Tax=Alteribacter aurantiacus TaxID=254410 RepID=UPI00040ABA6F|nr:hypothetical protein [Alteribacter aurantiacus]